MSYNEIGDEGAKHIAEALKENKALTHLEYVTAHTLCLHQSLSLLNVVLCSLFATKRQQPADSSFYVSNQSTACRATISPTTARTWPV